jgi:hypothetical protein
MPPGYRAKRTSLDELFDACIVHTTIRRLAGARPEDPWVATRLQRLEATLEDNEGDFDEV